MSYGKFAVDILRSDLGFYREIDGAWVVVYQGVTDSGGPIYLRVIDPPDTETSMAANKNWTAAGINDCTLFKTYEEACKGARRSEYIMKTLTLARVMQLKIKVEVQIDMLADRPIGVLDALAEIKP